jgi:hypothetical protein
MIRRTRLKPRGRGVAATPTIAEYLATVTAKAHPRTVTVADIRAGTDFDSRWGTGSEQVSTKVTAWIAETLPTEPLAAIGGGAIKTICSNEADKIIVSALLWMRVGVSDPARATAALAESIRRVNNIVTWDATDTGVTAYILNDLGGADLIQALGLAYDWMFAEFSAGEKTNLQACLNARVTSAVSNGVYATLWHGTIMHANPMDSHRAVNTARVAVACIAMAGVDTLYDTEFTNLLPDYIENPISWGSSDGGFGGGTAYAMWDVSVVHFVAWAYIKTAMGRDLWATAWAQNHGKFITYFTPPGTTCGSFGDDAEVNYSGTYSSVSTQIKSYSDQIRTPLVSWVCKKYSGEQKWKPAMLLAAQEDLSLVSATIPANTPNAIHITSVGYVAMHSDLGDLTRTSGYFISNPFGSYVHAHADQNSFTILSNGKRLAIDSGYYDSFFSTHHLNWYKQTVAHNAITYDHGTGQTKTDDNGSFAAKGRITAFENTTDYDLTTGDASAAYTGLTNAIRSIVYIRTIDAFVIFDYVSASSAKTWEWNIHAVNAITKNSNTDILLTNTETLRVRMIDSPTVTYADHTTWEPGWYEGIPSPGTAYNPTSGAAQTHGRFTVSAASTSAVFVTLLEIGAGGAAYGVSGTGLNRVVTIGGKTLTFNGTSVVVT